MERASNITSAPPRLAVQRLSPGACYLAVSAAILLVWVGFYLFNPFGFDHPARDSWHHVAVLRELMASPFGPSNPHIPTHDPSRDFTPIAVLAALIGKLFGASPYRLFGYMGAATCVGLVAACWTFGRRYYGSPWAPLILLLTLLFGWGTQLGHTGLHNYATLLSSAAYPSTIALVLGIFAWNCALRAIDCERDRQFQLALLAALSATILLEHQLTGVFVLAGAGTLVFFHERSDIRSKSAALAAITLGSLATLAWPYFSILQVLFSASDPRWASVLEGMNFVSTALILGAPALVGVLGFRKTDGGLRCELLVPSAAFTAAYIGLVLTNSPIAHRVPPAIILYNQLGLVWLALAYAQSADYSRRTKVVVSAAAMLLIAGSALSSGLTRLDDLQTRDSEESLIDMAQALEADLPPNSVSFATENVVYPLQSTGRRVVSIPRPEPTAPSLPMRQAATDSFFSAASNNRERQALIDRWGATNVVFVRSDLQPQVVADLHLLGPSKRFSHDVEAITLQPTTGRQFANVDPAKERGIDAR